MHGEIKKKSLQTDVLIVGAGGAGLRAGIEAHKIGVSIASRPTGSRA